MRAHPPFAFRTMIIAILLLGSVLAALAIRLGSQPAYAAPPAPPAAAAPECAPNWELVPSPNPHSSNRLEAVAALAPNDVWAVGYTFDFAQTPDQTLTMHWDGTQWTHIASPNPVAGSYLEDVEALASDNVWAVGYAYVGYAQTLIEHWNGSQWSVVPSPNQGPSTNELMGLDAISPTDIWAVGNTPGTHNTVTMHWDGNQWTVVPSLPNDFSNTYVMGDVAAIAPNDVWAVGYYYPESGAHRTVTIHWNGTTWTRIASPNPGAYVSRLFDVTAVSSNEVWAVGHYSNDGGATYHNLTMKWNGTAWNVVSSPSLGDYEGLNDVTVAGDGELWAVGSWHYQNFPTAPAHTTVLRWDGSTWQVAPSPDGGRFNNELYGVGASGQGDMWAVGRSYGSYNTPWDTLTLRNRCTVLTPTPGPPTATRTATLTATPGIPSSCAEPHFGAATSFPVGDGPERLIVADLDRDGNRDLVVGNRTAGTLSVLLGNGLGGFGPAGTVALGTAPAGIVAGDFNHDANPDLAVAGYGLNRALVVLGDGLGGFGPPAGYTTGSGPAAIAAADFNGDGHLDLGTANRFADTLSVLLGNGTGSFGSSTPYGLGWVPLDIATGDFNGDGHPDVAAANSFTDDVTVRLGNGTGGFSAAVDYAVGTTPISLAIGDLNHDGALDWVTSNQDSQNVSVRLGNGSGGFGAVAHYPAGNGSAVVGIADVTADGHPDLAVASVPGTVLVLMGTGTGSFGPPASFAVGGGPRAVVVADFNGDGKGDLAATDNTNDTALVLLNSCQASGVTPTPPGATATAPAPTSTQPPATGTPAPVPTGTPPATGTSTPPGASATTTPPHATPTACVVTFTDVPAGNPFYIYIRCLVCRGIVSGYNDGTFRPFAQLTRGQAAKIISNAAGFSDIIPSTQQTFTDVAPSSPFWLFVERVALHGAISGYSNSPPCTTGLPCFLPGNNVTRGQFAKMAAAAAGYAEPIPSTQQTFSDVAYGSAFWVYVERINLHGVISGYQCGQPPAGGCDPAQRPWFLPSNEVTRGQAAKIVANTFFPNCQTP
ncbi:MAG TPA: FG-GAP-like repeat-containing protein [Chloroflexia bacterium]|nr:FG-GAP-like repeat-containing protein [Chloroflexia bacterium]